MGISHSIALFATYFSRRRPVLVVNRGVSFPLDALNRIKFHVRMDAVVTVCEDIKKVIGPALKKAAADLDDDGVTFRSVYDGSFFGLFATPVWFALRMGA